MTRAALAYQDRGAGRPIVLLHAFPLSAAMWSDLSLPGRVRLGLAQVVLGGLSMGGYVAMELLRRAPERVSALLLADTKAQADTAEQRERRLRTAESAEQHGVGGLADTMLPALLGRASLDTRPGVVERVRELVSAADPPAVAWASRAMAARPDSFEVLRATDVPALVVVGDQDVLSPVAQARELAAALPQGRLAVIEEAGHLSVLEDPEVFGAAVTGFLDELG